MYMNRTVFNDRMNVLMTEVLKLQRDPEMDIAARVAKFEKLFRDMNTELRRSTIVARHTDLIAAWADPGIGGT